MTTHTEPDAPVGADWPDQAPDWPEQRTADSGPDGWLRRRFRRPSVKEPAPAAEVPIPAVADAASVEEPAAGRPVRQADRPAPMLVKGAAALGGGAAGGVGFSLSYMNLVEAARRWGFAEWGDWGAYAFPVGVDGAVIGFYAFDLFMLWRGTPKRMLRWAAHALTAFTVYLNIAAAANSMPGSPSVLDALSADPSRLISHSLMPAVFVGMAEGLRYRITKVARLEEERERGDRIPWEAWILRRAETWEILGTMRQWGLTYEEVREQRRRLAVHDVYVEYRRAEEERRAAAGTEDETEDDPGRVTVLDDLPRRLARHGVTVEEALQLPAQMRREEQQRRHAAARARRALEREAAEEQRLQDHEDAMARLRDQHEQLRAQNEVDVLAAQSEGERLAAVAHAEGVAATAAIQASAQQSAAQRAATEEQRLADQEEEAAETARTAALRRQAAEDQARALRQEEANVAAAEELARRQEVAAGRSAAAAEKEEEAKNRLAAAADREAKIKESQLRTAQMTVQQQRAELAITVLGDALGLTDRQRTIRRVARHMQEARSQGGPETVTTGEIESAFRCSNGTASGYRADALKLIDDGYDWREDPLHQVVLPE
ncbi:DUF2637 domain-containing protein [Streptomyces sp. VTCC 41912]|uniref:DUF2637 domain-containing protein n=1 Tax=Streptomyces sp. VTCC 41912 TaxID=3383243 RepID=UPI003896DFBC